MFCIVLFFYLPNIVDKMTYSQNVAFIRLPRWNDRSLIVLSLLAGTKFWYREFYMP